MAEDKPRTYFTKENIEKLHFILKSTVDEYCLDDGRLVRLDQLLYAYFKERLGYDNVIFYSFDKGIYFYDESTYDYFNCPPKKSDSKNSEFASQPSDFSSVFDSHRHIDKFVDGVPMQKSENKSDAEKINEKKRLRFGGNYDLAFSRIEMCINDRTVKNAVIIKDTVSFIERAMSDTAKDDSIKPTHKEKLRAWDEMLVDNQRNNNIIVWVSRQKDNIAKLAYFKDDTKTDDTLDTTKLTEIKMSPIGTKEIKNLVNRFRIIGTASINDVLLESSEFSDESGKKLKVDYSEYDALLGSISEKAMRYGLTLRDISDIFTMIAEKGDVLNDKIFNKYLGQKLESKGIAAVNDETYREALARLNTNLDKSRSEASQPEIYDQIKAAERVVRDLHISSKRAVTNSCRLDPTPESEFARLLKKDSDMFNFHLALVGPPGTGKTTFARIIGKAYRELGLLPSEKFVKVTRADLVGGYIGETALKTRAKIEEALGGTLFIDEAYTLARSGSNGADYGIEAIDTIVEAMTDHMGEFAVIIAGYENDIMHMISSNEGLRSRFGKLIRMDEYTPEKLADRMRKYIEDTNDTYGLKDGRRLQFSPEFDENLPDFVKALKAYYDLQKNKTNGRSEWASMRTVIQISTGLFRTAKARVESTGAEYLIIPDDLPPQERKVYNSILPVKSADNGEGLSASGETRGENVSVSANVNNVGSKQKRDALTLDNIKRWYNQNPFIMLAADQEASSIDARELVVLRRRQQGAVVFLYDNDGSCGTGTIVSPNGYILTARHVAESVRKGRAYVMSHENRIIPDFDVELVKVSEKYDLALLKANMEEPFPVYASVSAVYDKPIPKETPVKLIGYPLGVEAVDGPTIYDGKIASVSMTSNKFGDIYEIINYQGEGKRGNSGSPLFNAAMEVVGVFTGSKIGGDETLVEEINQALPIKYFIEEFVE